MKINKLILICAIYVIIYLYYKNIRYTHNKINEDFNGEDKCKYISSRGFLKICDIKSNNPISSSSSLETYNLDDIVDGSIVYICNSAIRRFANYLKSIDKKIILVSGDSDTTIYKDLFNSYDDFLNFIESDKIIIWFSQNCIVNHPKIIKLPIGLAYHSNIDISNKLDPVTQENTLIDIIKNCKPFEERILLAYSNFHFSSIARYGYDRQDAINNIPKDLVYYENNRKGRKETYENQSKYAFVISPHGNGYDCHRTWEALILGCIPIVKKSNLDDLYIDLPVLIVNNWSDITLELLEKTIKDYKNKIFNYDKLTLKYWIDKINSYK